MAPRNTVETTSNERPDHPAHPGYLLRELGYDDEIESAASLDITPQTLAGYRKAGIGPDYTELARRIFYSKKARAKWLAAGGTRAAEEALKGSPSPFPATPVARVRQKAVRA